MKDQTSLRHTKLRFSRNCHVCGDVARGLNFNVISCMSCKSFFRRNAYKQLLVSSCRFQNNCNITKETRGCCSPCRLTKCLALGMDPVLIRSIPLSTTVYNKIQPLQSINNKPVQLPTPLPLSLLRNDRSMLTTCEWRLLSNFLHAYDEQNLSIRIKHSLDQLSSLPPKLRLKPSDTYNIVEQFFTGIQSLIERSPDLYSLPPNARRALTKHNLHSTGAVNGIFLCRELDLFNNPVFLNPCMIFYGAAFMTECAQNSARYDQNGSLIKIMLFVMSFCSNCSIVTYDDQEDITTMSTSLDLIRVQDMYITTLWKYLVYLCGFKEAVIRYSDLVKMIIDVIHMLERMPKNETHEHMIDRIVVETERALIIKN